VSRRYLYARRPRLSHYGGPLHVEFKWRSAWPGHADRGRDHVVLKTPVEMDAFREIANAFVTWPKVDSWSSMYDSVRLRCGGE